MLTAEEYRQVLKGLEMQLQRYREARNSIAIDPLGQKLRSAWGFFALELKREYPAATFPIPFWEKEALEGAPR